MSIEFSDRTLPTMRGGPLNKDVFQFVNVEFRWGPEDSLGAEHSINGIWLETISLRIATVLFRTRFKSFYRLQVLHGGTDNALEHSLRIDREVLRQTRWNCGALLPHASTDASYNRPNRFTYVVHMRISKNKISKIGGWLPWNS